MNLIRLIAVLLVSLTAVGARADVNANLNLIGGTYDAWAFNGSIQGNAITTLSFTPASPTSMLYTVIVDLDVRQLTGGQFPVSTSASLDNSPMSFSLGAQTASFTFGGLLDGGPHMLSFDFTDKSFAAIGARISVASTPSPAPVPEPESWAMLLAGLGLLGHVARKRGATQAA